MTSLTESCRPALALPMCTAGNLWRNSVGGWGSVEVAEGGGAEQLLLQLSLLAVLGGRGGDICRRRRKQDHTAATYPGPTVADKTLKSFASIYIDTF